MRSIVVSSFLIFCTATVAAARPAADHLKCFKVKDPQAKAAYVADLDGLVAETGCLIKTPAALVCVPSSKTNVTPPPPGGGGTGTPNPFGCYKLKCPKGTVPPTLALHDQFGTRVVAPSKAKMLCAPGEGVTTTTVTSSTTTTTTPCTQTFEPTLRVAAEVSEALAPGGDYLFPVSCNGSPAMCCPGGVPTASCGPLHFEPSSATIIGNFAASNTHLTYRGHAAT